MPMFHNIRAVSWEILKQKDIFLSTHSSLQFSVLKTRGTYTILKQQDK